MNTGTADLEATAREFQKIFSLGINEYNRKLFSFISEAEMVYPGCRVIDIGCGVGKHGTYFASIGCDVTLTDISAPMLERAKANMSGFTTPWRTLLLDFRTASPDKLPSPFDFSFSSMSPAVTGIEDVDKMTAITDGWCFVSNFISWSQPKRDAFYAAMDLDAAPGMSGRVKMYSLLEQMKLSGYSPEVKTVPYSWCDRRTKEEAVQTLLWHRGIDIGIDSTLTAKAAGVISSLCDGDGLFTDSIDTEVMWLYWKT